MYHNNLPKVVFPIGLALLFIGVILLGLNALPARSTFAPRLGISRHQDPVILTGAALTAFDGVPINELKLYAFQSETWHPIPFQIDELTASGVYTPVEDGLLDANDELVFMGKDAGAWAASTDWVADDEAQLNPRYVITVTDPIQPDDPGHAYLYRSTTLTGTNTSYVDWDEASQRVTALSYTLSFSLSQFIGLADFTVNGHGVDILDRQKIRLKIHTFLVDLTFNEEQLVDLLGMPPTITLPIAGPVRATGGDGTSTFAFFAGRLDIRIALPLSEFELPIPGATIDSLRLSLDLNDPSTTGLAPATYYDSNTPGGVPIDGEPDDIDATPPITWYQASGSLGGVGFVIDVNAGADLLSNYYRDDGTVDDADTGDQQSFADTGILIEKSGPTLGDIFVAQTAYILPPGSGNVGNTLEMWSRTPLVATVAVQHSSAGARTYLPLVLHP